MISTFDRYFFREVSLSAMAICLILVSILAATRLARVLAQALAGDIPADIVFALIGLKSIEKLSVLLPLAMFIAMLMALGRMNRDNELVALFSAGLGRRRLLRTLLLTAVPFATVTAVVVIFLAPWSSGTAERLTAEARSMADISGFAQGRFAESSNGKRVFYAEQVSADSREMRNVFLFIREPGGASDDQASVGGPGDSQVAKQALVTAKSARVETNAETGERFLVLEQGFRYDGRALDGPFRVIEFEHQGVLLKPKQVLEQLPSDARSSAELARSDLRRDSVELQWRLFSPVMVLVLALVALAVGISGPRSGKYSRLPIGIVFYILYSNLHGVARVWAEQGGLPVWLSGWWMHAVVAVVVIGIAFLPVRARPTRLLARFRAALIARPVNGQRGAR